MRTFAIGDIQGCHKGLVKLLNKLEFNETSDQLWLCGDLVNRGGKSLETLREIYNIRNSVRMVLGNHDLHLLATFHGVKLLPSQSDLIPILRAADGEEMIHWLQQQPLIIHDKKHILVHAGIAPQWNLKTALALAGEVHKKLRANNSHKLLRKMYSEKPRIWRDDLTGMKRLRCIINHFTRMRYVSNKYKLDFSCKSHPKYAAKNLIPWFSHPQRHHFKEPILFGHWASLMGQTNDPHYIGLDTGYIWGGALTAYQLETKTFTHVKAKQ